MHAAMEQAARMALQEGLYEVLNFRRGGIAGKLHRAGDIVHGEGGIGRGVEVCREQIEVAVRSCFAIQEGERSFSRSISSPLRRNRDFGCSIAAA
jgi:hypothetical protein